MFPLSKKAVHLGNQSHPVPGGPSNPIRTCETPAAQVGFLTPLQVTQLLLPWPDLQQPHLCDVWSWCPHWGSHGARTYTPPDPLGPLPTPYTHRHTHTLRSQQPPHRRRCHRCPTAGMAPFPPQQLLHRLLHTHALVRPGWGRGLLWSCGCKESITGTRLPVQTVPSPRCPLSSRVCLLT